MEEISDEDRSVFADANRSVGLNLTSDEKRRIAELAKELKGITDNAKKRLQEKFVESVDAQAKRTPLMAIVQHGSWKSEFAHGGANGPAESAGIGAVNSAREQCPERERFLREWTQCGRRLAKLLDEQLAARNSSAPDVAGFEEQIRLARSAETEACRKYFGHVNTHDCV